MTAGTVVSVLAEPQQQQVVRESAQCCCDDGLLQILDSITVVVHIHLADDACSDESDGEVKVELA